MEKNIISENNVKRILDEILNSSVIDNKAVGPVEPKAASAELLLVPAPIPPALAVDKVEVPTILNSVGLHLELTTATKSVLLGKTTGELNTLSLPQP